MKIELGGKVNQSIQGLRGVAALAVLLVHVHFMAAKAGFTQLNEGAWIHHAAGFGVMLFFCISGYLIVGTLTRSGDVRAFALKRIIRIYPVFLLLHFVMFGLGPSMNYEWMGTLRGDPLAWAGHFISNFLFLPGLFDLPIAQKNAWSLSYEASFYIIAAVLYIGWRGWGSARGKVLVLLGVGGTLALLEAEPKVIFFAVGSLVWWLEGKRRLDVPLSGLLGAVGCLVGFKLYIEGRIALSALAVLPFFACIAAQNGWPAAALRVRPVVWLGKVSYSLYLVHPFVLDPLRRICLKFGHQTSPGAKLMIFVGVGITSAIIAAGLSFELIEVRLTRWLFSRPKVD